MGRIEAEKEGRIKDEVDHWELYSTCQQTLVIGESNKLKKPKKDKLIVEF